MEDEEFYMDYSILIFKRALKILRKYRDPSSLEGISKERKKVLKKAIRHRVILALFKSKRLFPAILNGDQQAL